MPKPPVKTKLAREYRDKHGLDMAHKQLSKIMYEENKAIFKDAEEARYYLRAIEGKSGKRNTVKVTHPHETRPINPYNIPMPDGGDLEPYKLPTQFNNFILAGDFHVPNHRIEPIQAMLNYAQQNNIKQLFLNGDLLDNTPFTRWQREPISPSDVPRWFDMAKALLVELKKQFDEIYWLEGNHDFWYERYLMQKAPELFGDSYYKLENRLGLNEIGVKYIQQKYLVKAGHLNITHGHLLLRGGGGYANAARMLYMKTKANTICSHVHVESSHTEPDLNDKIVTTFSTGCMCHDDKTEILTENGFILFPEYKNEKIAEYNMNTGSIYYNYPLKVQIFDYEGDMYNFVSRRFDQLVTPEHKMLVYRNDRVYNKYFDLSAYDLFNRSKLMDMPISGKMVGSLFPNSKSEDESKLLSELAGFIITDGHYRKESGGIRLYQKVCYNRVKYLLDTLKFKYSIGYSRSIPCFNISAGSSNIIRSANPIKNRISRSLLNMGYSSLKCLYEGLISGDGHRQFRNELDKKGKDYFSSHSLELAEDFQELCCKVGYSGKITFYEGINTNKKEGYWHMYKVLVRKFNVSRIKNKNIVSYNGKVYDFTTNSGYFIVRRNGVISVSGNCTLRPEYQPYGGKACHGFAHVTVQKNRDFSVKNYRIYKGEIL